MSEYNTNSFENVSRLFATKFKHYKKDDKKRPAANQLEPITVHLLRLKPVTNQDILRKILVNW